MNKLGLYPEQRRVSAAVEGGSRWECIRVHLECVGEVLPRGHMQTPKRGLRRGSVLIFGVPSTRLGQNQLSFPG